MIIKIYTVNCDGDSNDCHGWIAQADRATTARREAKQAGWVRREGRDLCPSCKSEEGE